MSKFVLTALLTICLGSFGYADTWLTNLEAKYSVRKFDEQIVFVSKEEDEKWHAYLYSSEYPNFIFLEGGMYGPVIENFLEISEKYPQAKYLLLNNDGGRSYLGLKLGKLISRFGFSTVILSNSRCASACSTAFMGGEKRYAFGKLLLHQNRYHNCKNPKQKEKAAAVSSKLLEFSVSDVQNLISETLKYLKTVPQSTPDWFITETLDRKPCGPLYDVPVERKLELSDPVENTSIYEQIKNLQQEEGTLLALNKFYSSNLRVSPLKIPDQEEKSKKDDVTIKTEPAFTSGSLTLACAASSSEYSLNFSSHNLKTFDEFEFQMVARNETDNACNVPERGLSGTISFVPSSGLAIIEVPLTEQSGKSFFWHEVFGIGYNVDINFDFSKNVGVGDNAELKLHQ